jgi:hypothetical protein
MAKKNSLGKVVIEPTVKRSSSSGNPAMVKTSSMNKNKRRSFKKYRGQGR